MVWVTAMLGNTETRNCVLNPVSFQTWSIAVNDSAVFFSINSSVLKTRSKWVDLGGNTLFSRKQETMVCKLRQNKNVDSV